MKRFKISIMMLLYIVNIFVLSTNYIYADKEKTEKLNVLFITSYNYDFISFDDQVKGLRKGFNNNVNIRSEYMDAKVFADKEYEKEFYNFIKQSLEIYNIDAIIAGDDDATEFCIKYRDDLFEDIPISFLGVQDKVRRERALDLEKVSGVAEIESIEANIELIKQFHPEVDTITFIDTYAVNLYEEITSKYEEFKFEWIVTNDVTLEVAKDMMSSLDKNDAVISLYVQNFSDTGTLHNDEIQSIIAQSCGYVPIYNILSYDIGFGSIGGKVINHFEQGKNAAKVALGLLNGKDEEEIYVNMDNANSYIFDYRNMIKFGIKEKDLPKDYIILNSPSESFEQYKEVIIGFIMLIIALIFIVITLLIYLYNKAKYQKAIVRAKNSAEEASKLKSHFISNISHELKTPINVIMSAVQLNKLRCIKDPLFNKYITNLDIIDDNCNRLLRLINNIIDVQKFELEQKTLDLKNINIVEVVESLVESVIPYACQKDLNIVFDTEHEEIFIDADINKIERIILNLLSNAIKYSEKYGNIIVYIKYEKDLHIIVQDEGIGINNNDLNSIFDKFTQVDNSLRRKTEGSGIGLSIVKSFVELHGGEVYVESMVNVGTKFTVKLPTVRYSSEKEIDINKEKLINNIKVELSDIYL